MTIPQIMEVPGGNPRLPGGSVTYGPASLRPKNSISMLNQGTWRSASGDRGGWADPMDQRKIRVGVYAKVI